MTSRCCHISITQAVAKKGNSLQSRVHRNNLSDFLRSSTPTSVNPIPCHERPPIAPDCHSKNTICINDANKECTADSKFQTILVETLLKVFQLRGVATETVRNNMKVSLGRRRIPVLLGKFHPENCRPLCNDQDCCEEYGVNFGQYE